MERDIITVYCLIDEYLKVSGIKDDVRAEISNAEVLLIGYMAVNDFSGNYYKAFFIDLAQSLFDELDTHPHYKIHYIGLGASNCTGIHKRKSFSILEIEKDTKHAKLTQGLMKIRDKYGVDMIGYGRERVG